MEDNEPAAHDLAWRQALAVILFTAFLGVGAQQPGAQPGSGRGPAGPPQSTPRLFDGTPNLGKTFRDAGYATLFIGKQGNTYKAGNEAFETFIYHGEKDHAEAPQFCRRSHR